LVITFLYIQVVTDGCSTCGAQLLTFAVNITVAILDVTHCPVFYLKLNSTQLSSALLVCLYLIGITLHLRYEPNRLMPSIGLWQWHINITITILDIIHLSQETETRYIYCAQLSRFHLKTETESSLLDVVFYIKDRTMDNAFGLTRVYFFLAVLRYYYYFH
jgi:hypothetical protein